MIVNIALLTVTDTRTIDNDKSGAILVEKIKEANHQLIDRKICKDNKGDIVKILKDWTNHKDMHRRHQARQRARHQAPLANGYLHRILKPDRQM